ncbi:exonuclease subunit SbcD [Paenimyroides tangerinum]|uniref:Nuclease SbcCD subunit D n=1 Tax=Paenimyroides tangerinum TaxID=2488728 RepID=A0A3P3W5Z0_9FLAO|nr:exonuclease SbcCD subunit D C-terminal domain-containing protein [Paenimyroides tangerinum]RRJ90104.1 exonuclease subunit SbcD [Paenimyroides tangerinum]
MRFLHTSDWHIGQTFYDFDRHQEHKSFLDWLNETLKNKQIDVLLVAGDIFDTANPSGSSITLFYSFLSQITNNYPNLQVVIIAGNHDSAIRLEMPIPLLQNTKVSIIGSVKKREDKSIDYDALTIPLFNSNNEIEVFCLAIPFLRIGDYPKTEEGNYEYNYGVSKFYAEAFKNINSKKTANQSVIAMGHLHAMGVETDPEDTAERPIIGGVENINTSSFPTDLKYVALGHIHKPQRLSANDSIRYSGSPIPLSFSEKTYKHQVVVFEINNGNFEHLEIIEIPIHTPLLSVPKQNKILEEVFFELENLPLKDENDKNQPYLEVKVLLNEPIPDLKNRIQEIVQTKNVRLARIDTKFPKINAKTNETELQNEIELHDLQPIHVLNRIYSEKYNEEIPNELDVLFEDVLTELNHDNQN